VKQAAQSDVIQPVAGDKAPSIERSGGNDRIATPADTSDAIDKAPAVERSPKEARIPEEERR
jgi:hypothetical protein